MSQTRANLTPFSPTVLSPAAMPARAAEAALPGDAAAARRILIATIASRVGNTGVQTHTRSLHDGLIAAGHSCIIQTAFNGGPWWLPIFGVRRVFGPLNRSWSTRWYRRWHARALGDAIMRVLRRQEFDAVLAQCPVSAHVALQLRQRLGLRFSVVMACHFNYSEAKEYRDMGELADEATYQEIIDFEHRILGAVDRIVYVSGWARRVVEKDRGIAVRESSVIWNGIAPHPGGPGTLRRDLKVSEDDLLLINVGTLERRKNQIGLIDLFADIAKQWPRAHLALVGDGPDRGEIRRRIEERGLSSRVHLLGTRRDVPELLNSADIYIHYSTMENCPLVLIEAARASLPVVAVPEGGVPELLEALGGVAIDAASNSASINTLRPLLDDAAVRRAAGLASRAAFEKSFTRQAMVGEYLKALCPAEPASVEVMS